MRIVVFGAPGSGKGTQVDRIKADAGAIAISPGDLLRQALTDATPAGIRAEAFMRRGELVPDELVIQIVHDRVARPDARRGYILDGYPRTLGQLEALERVLPALGIAPEAWLFIDVPEAVIEERVVGRRICAVCQTTWHVRFNPSPRGERCGRCGGELVRRTDDSPEKLRTRLDAYHRDTMPVIAQLRAERRLLTVDAEALDPDAVESRVRTAIGLAPARRDRVA